MAELETTRPALLILGASARAAASSAWRAGFNPIAVDLFADRDLAARFPAHRADRDTYPADLARIAIGLPDAPWVYTGALENHPGLVDRIGRERPLLGISGDALRSVRDPQRWTAALRTAGIPVLESRLAGDPPPTTGDWVLKPLASASGRGIRPWTLGEGPIPAASQLQTRREGLSIGATFLGHGASARLVGVTRQLLGASAGGLRAAYRGSVGPWPIAPEVEAALVRWGAVLTSCFGLRGLFGVDAIVSGGTVWPVEINPRYSASVEVLEAALGLTLIADHARTFGRDVETPPRFESRKLGAAAKLILFARQPGQAPIDWPWTDPTDPQPTIADLPAPGTILEPGDPVLTVLARGPTVEAALARLKARAATWRRRIDGWLRVED